MVVVGKSILKYVNQQDMTLTLGGKYMKLHIERASGKNLRYKKNEVKDAEQDRNGDWYINIFNMNDILNLMKQTKCQLVMGYNDDNEPFIIIYDGYLE